MEHLAISVIVEGVEAIGYNLYRFFELDVMTHSRDEDHPQLRGPEDSLVVFAVAKDKRALIVTDDVEFVVYLVPPDKGHSPVCCFPHSINGASVREVGVDDLTVYNKVFVAMKGTKARLRDSAIVSTYNVVKLKGVSVIFVHSTLCSEAIMTNEDANRFVGDVTATFELGVIIEEVTGTANTLENLKLRSLSEGGGDSCHTSAVFTTKDIEVKHVIESLLVRLRQKFRGYANKSANVTNPPFLHHKSVKVVEV
jgi:hypothetical protein